MIERHLPDRNPVLFCLFGLIPRFEAYLMSPPVLESGYWNRGQIVPLHRVAIFRAGLGQFLHEREEIDPFSALSKFVYHWIWIIQELVFIRVESADSDQASLNLDVPTADLQ